MEKFKFIEPELIKAGSDKMRLGLMRYAPKVDCRVLSEDAYQELKKAYDLVCDGECSNENTGSVLELPKGQYYVEIKEEDGADKPNVRYWWRKRFMKGLELVVREHYR